MKYNPTVLNEQRPLPVWVAMNGVLYSVRRTAALLREGRIQLPRNHVGERVRFANGTAESVYRESLVDRTPPARPAVLCVQFRLRLVRGVGHGLFRWESMLNTPLFIGFPGFVSKLWFRHDSEGSYRGIYQWDDPARAEAYARALWQVLAIGCVPGSIHYHVIPDRERDEFLRTPPDAEGGNEWWRPVAIESRER